MQVILIGAGRYGNGLVGKKHKEGVFNTELEAVVDPRIKEISAQTDYNLGKTPQYDNFKNIPKEKITKDTIVEIAVNPEVIPTLFNELAQNNVKNVIFPKPVATKYNDYQELVKNAIKYNIRTAVTSNWYYSDITKLTKAILQKVQGKKVKDKLIANKYKPELDNLPQKFKIEKVELEYNKQYEKLDIDPPAQELPHALQIINATGLCDYNGITFKLPPNKQSPSAVNVNFQNVKGIKKGITINSDLQMGNKLDKQRERLLKVYLNDDDPQADIITDYDALFDKTGLCIKPANIFVDITKNGKTTKWTKTIWEDNLNVMYHDIIGFFEDKIQDVATLEKYELIAKYICAIQSAWEKITKSPSTKE